MKQPPDYIIDKILLFFMKTSVPRILEQNRLEEKEEKNSA